MAKIIRRAGRVGILLLVLVMVLGTIFYLTGEWVWAQDKEPDMPAEPDPFQLSHDSIISSIQTGDTGKAAENLQLFIADYSQDARYAEAIGSIADTYRQEQNVQTARGLYEYVLATFPKDPQAFWAEVWLTVLDISACTGSCGQATVDTLFSKYTGDLRLGGAACMIGDEYRRMGRHVAAGRWYRYGAEQWPESDFTLWSRMGSAISHIAMGRKHDAQMDIAILFADHVDDTRMAHAVCQIGDAYRRREDFQEAGDLYEYAVYAWPDAQHTLWCRMGAVISDIALGNEPNAAEATQRLLSHCSQDEGLPNAACQIGDAYQKAGRYQEARDLHGYVIANWPAAEHAIWCQKGLAVTEIHYTADPNTYPALDKLLTDYGEHPRLPQAAFFAAEAYRDEAVSLRAQGRDTEADAAYARAASALEQVIQRVQPSMYTPESYYLLAECYEQTGNHGRAIAYYQFIADTWPDWEMAWSARFQVGYRYEHLKQAGLIGAASANQQIRTAYASLLTMYPDCPAARAAGNWLNRHSN